MRADRGQVGQVVLNLAVNARDAMPSGGRLAIEAANVSLGAAARAKGLEPGPYVRLSFRDTGHGMSPGVRAHLFEPFFTTKPKGRGTGLGLPTVYGIVKQSGGHVEVESQEGAGTAVHVYLPRSDEPATPARPAAEAPRRGGSETVLVVEDDRHVREVTVRTLREAGYRVIVAPEAGAALAAAAAEPGPIDLLVTDVIMPGLDGRALAGQLCGHRPGLRVLYVSGYAERVVAEGGVLAAGLELLSKPFTPTALLDRVRAALDKAPEGPGRGGVGPTG